MRRWPAAVTLISAFAAAVSPAAAEPPAPASVKLSSCSIETRSAAFHARMRQVAGSERMWLRYTLQLKEGGGFHVLKAPGLGRWRKSKPGVAAFGYRQVVRGLQPGAVYRVRVDFRWYDADGKVLETAHRRSAPCRQFADVPNLAVSILDAEPGRKPGVMRYHVEAWNDGLAPASGVPVALLVDGITVNTVTVVQLLPGEHRDLTIHGPECEGSVEVRIDPDGVIVESSESDNADRLACAEIPSGR
jgi:hypothetical protein